MFPEIEETIVKALREEFQNDLFLKSSMIIPSKFQKEDVENPPATMPAIRVIFAEATPQEYAEVEGDYYAGELTYSVLFFFRNFQIGNGHVYEYLQRIVNRLKNLETPRGKVRLGRITLMAGEGFFVYSIETKVPAFV
jgi:hypothetical protein